MRKIFSLITAPILKSPDWDQIFHVHIDALAFAIGCILAQPSENYMDFSISYASRQMNSAERNYLTTEREGLAMVYAIKKFRHYLLENKFIFCRSSCADVSSKQTMRYWTNYSLVCDFTRI